MEPDQGDAAGARRVFSFSNFDPTDEDEALILEFHDRKVSQKYCLRLKEFDGKGIFIMKQPGQNEVVGLYEVVHALKMKHLFYPLTVRDIVSLYVKNISIYEDSIDKMNLVTEHGVRVQMRDPLVKVFDGGLYATETLYLQNKNYLNWSEGTEEDDGTTVFVEKSMFSRVEVIGLSITIVIFVGIILVLWKLSFT